MDFRQLEAFCAVAEQGSFSEAALCLFLTQPTVSSHICALEASLNTRLLERTTRSVSVTQEGRQFYEYAKSLLRLREKTLSEFTKPSQNAISLGASSIPSAYLLPEVLSAYHKKSPSVTFDVMQSDSQGVLDRLLDGRLDMGITGTPLRDERFCCQPIYRDEMVLAAPYSPYFSELLQSCCPLEKLLEEPYLMREDGSGTRRETERFLKTMSFDSASLHIAARMNDLEMIKQAIIYGLGISILSKRVTRDPVRDNRMLIVPLAQGGVYRSYYLICRKNRRNSRQLGAFIKFVEAYPFS